MVNGIIAGGKKALHEAVEFAEDDRNKGWNDLLEAGVTSHDVVLGLSASGSAPYVLHALESCRKAGICTGSLSCNPDAPVSALADFAIEVVVGPEFITGSTRLKAGTAQKLVLNMISTTVMIHLGRVEDNKMVHMKLSNEKLIQRGTGLVMKLLKITDEKEARHLLLQAGTVKAAIKNYHL
jgi:N-acetylmuramic acid 6-phosphate etherase